MRRAEQDNGELPGQDSFLDIVANIVGILILLVMVVGMRAAQGFPDAAPAAGETAQEAVETLPDDAPEVELVSTEQVESSVRRALATRREVITKMKKAAAAREEIDLRNAERLELTTFVAAVEQQIEEQRQKMGADQRRDFDLQAKLGAAEHELEKLTRERVALVSYEPEVEQIESLPTPIASTVSGEELQLRLAGGHVRIIPWDELNKAARAQAEENLWRLTRRDSMTVVAGPIGGFRVRYLVEKRTFATQQGMVTQIGSASQILEPTADVLGEPVADALRPDSQLMAQIARASTPRKPTITIWTYPDSFDEFRELKATLFKQGYSVAGRPLADGDPIGRSPRGTKSAAQ